jgi:hypothetical protein
MTKAARPASERSRRVDSPVIERRAIHVEPRDICGTIITVASLPSLVCIAWWLSPTVAEASAAVCFDDAGKAPSIEVPRSTRDEDCRQPVPAK